MDIFAMETLTECEHRRTARHVRRSRRWREGHLMALTPDGQARDTPTIGREAAVGGRRDGP